MEMHSKDQSREGRARAERRRGEHGSLRHGVLAILGAFALTAAANPVSADDETTVELLTRLEHQFAAAALSGDATGVAELLAPEFVGVDPRGRELSRDDVLAGLQAPGRELISLRHENVRVRLFDHCAVVLAVTVMEARHEGREVSGQFPYMRVWIERDGRWLAVATQSSAAPP